MFHLLHRQKHTLLDLGKHTKRQKVSFQAVLFTSDRVINEITHRIECKYPQEKISLQHWSAEISVNQMFVSLSRLLLTFITNLHRQRQQQHCIVYIKGWFHVFVFRLRFLIIKQQTLKSERFYRNQNRYLIFIHVVYICGKMDRKSQVIKIRRS